jgi:CRISPR-associated protein Cmr5
MRDDDRKTLEQLRARHALNAVHEVQSTNKAASYKRVANGLAATIVNSGLGQACASLKAKGDGGADQIYDDLSAWLSAGGEYAAPYSGDLIRQMTQNGQRSYVHAQSEALAWLEWTKKFARAYLDTEEDSSGE